jgi:NADPH:quinone reductase-like Zn-dependent oxidoreductase
LQQFALVRGSGNPATTAKVPDNVTDDEASTLPTALNTAFIALYDQKDGFGFPYPFDGGESFGKGKAILVMGGSSAIGLSGILLPSLPIK